MINLFCIYFNDHIISCILSRSDSSVCSFEEEEFEHTQGLRIYFVYRYSIFKIALVSL